MHKPSQAAIRPTAVASPATATAPSPVTLTASSAAASPVWSWVPEGACIGLDLTGAPGGAGASPLVLTSGPTNATLFNLRGVALSGLTCAIRATITDAYGTESSASAATAFTVREAVRGGAAPDAQ